MTLPGGYLGKFLRVDLSGPRIQEEELGNQLIENYVGGTGIGARILYDEVPPGVEWNDPKNRIIFFSGPLGATRISGTGTFSVVTKGPMTNMAGCSQANGLFGAYLKLAGFDGFVVQGASPKLVYLYIHDGKAELRDARHLQGKGTFETEEISAERTGPGLPGKRSVRSAPPGRTWSALP